MATATATEIDVRLAQQLLHDFDPGPVDGVCGPLTAAAVERARWALGYPEDRVDGALDTQLLAFLGGAPLPPDYEARGEARARQLPLRARIVAVARWGIAHEREIHYAERRPIDGIHRPFALPLSTDCSGFATLCYAWAGAPDPNGNGFSGFGYTGTMLDHCRHIAAAAAQPGDLVVFGPGTGDHVCVRIGAAPDPLLCSHGQEAGPLAVPFSIEAARHRPPVTWLSCLN